MKFRHVALLLGSASLLVSGSATALAAKQKSQRAELVTTQLPRNVVPTHYSIRATPDATNLAFSGSTDIEITVKSATDRITLNAADLMFSSASIVSDTARTPATKIDVDAKAQTATFRFAQKLKPGKYTLSTAYTGKIYQQANGLFALDYKDPKGAVKRALFTQFEAPDARRFVPSWDEPNYKATFDLTAVVPENEMPEDKALALEALQLALTTEPGATTSAAMISAVAAEHPDLAVDFAIANLPAVEALVDVASRSEYIAQVANGSEDPAMPAKLDAHAKKHLAAGSRKPVDQAITTINTRIKTRPRIKAQIGKWLDKQG